MTVAMLPRTVAIPLNALSLKPRAGSRVLVRIGAAVSSRMAASQVARSPSTRPRRRRSPFQQATAQATYTNPMAPRIGQLGPNRRTQPPSYCTPANAIWPLATRSRAATGMSRRAASAMGSGTPSGRSAPARRARSPRNSIMGR